MKQLIFYFFGTAAELRAKLDEARALGVWDASGVLIGAHGVECECPNLVLEFQSV